MEIVIFGRKFLFFAERRQWVKLVSLLREYLLHPVVVCALAIMAVTAALYIYIIRVGKSGIRQTIRKLSPWIYLFFITSISLLNRDWGSHRLLRLDLGYLLEGRSGFHETRILMAFCGFLYYIPYGFLLEWGQVTRGRMWKVTVILITCVVLEGFQYILACGTASTEECIIYSLGGLTGEKFACGLEKRKAVWCAGTKPR